MYIYPISSYYNKVTRLALGHTIQYYHINVVIDSIPIL